MGDSRDTLLDSVDAMDATKSGPVPSMCHLPHLGPVTAANGHIERKCVSITLDVTLDQVKKLCASHGISPICLFEAAWALTLSYYVGNNCVGFVLKADTEAAWTMTWVDLDKVTSVLDLLQALDNQHTQESGWSVDRLADIPGFFDEANRPLFNTTVSITQQKDSTARLCDQAAEHSQQVTKPLSCIAYLSRAEAWLTPKPRSSSTWASTATATPAISTTGPLFWAATLKTWQAPLPRLCIASWTTLLSH